MDPIRSFLFLCSGGDVGQTVLDIWWRFQLVQESEYRNYTLQFLVCTDANTEYCSAEYVCCRLREHSSAGGDGIESVCELQGSKVFFYH